jgi:hypothetical protein
MIGPAAERVKSLEVSSGVRDRARLAPRHARSVSPGSLLPGRWLSIDATLN